MILASHDVNHNLWNSAIIDAGFQGTIFQTTHWAEFLKKSYGDRPTYLMSIDKKGNPQSLLLAMESCYAKHPSSTLLGKKGFLFGQLYQKILSPMIFKVSPFIFWENGPIFLNKNENAFADILRQVTIRAQELGCYEIKFARPAYFADNNRLFFSFGFSSTRMGTFLVSLGKSEEELFSSIDKSSRKNIRKIEQEAVIRQAFRLHELEEFYRLHVESSNRLGTKIFPFSFFNSLWNFFSSSEQVVLFIAYYKDKPIGAIMCLAFNKTVHENFVADSNYARENRIYASDILKWHALKWANEKGYSYFDLSGVELQKIDEGNEKARNIYRFKSKWGGQLVNFNDYQQSFRANKLKTLGYFLSDSI
ncbi:MAG: lipid II:glycine glycyltransferase FemX [Candidatus Bathyarchaeia archaeon]|jgi:hypothetical protein